MTLNEFMELQERVANGEEFCFNYQNEEYWLSQNPEGYYLTRVRGSYTQEFDTSEALFRNGTIEGRFLSEVYIDLKW
ncbi:MAG TPA: hypothetical protein VNR38_23850 [Ureibacillus sp.]|uniref:hypothetical protein n=1 Tax=Peribacillus asahii TaxID=228899 RepID=UPI00207AECB1|nr:hypothetical protein [Peribacillus asahii]USK61765.1 hypothetical protein LIT37_10850 [Peribacillus asahii]HWL26746.1 hypothetical protein [Ureibacillus sp.]